MLIILKVVSIALTIWNFICWGYTNKGENENCISASSIYFLCFILLELFGG